jgi:hypothetical protein
LKQKERQNKHTYREQFVCPGVNRKGRIDTMLQAFSQTKGEFIPLAGTSPPIRKVKWALSAGVQRQGHEGVHSHYSSTEVKNERR